MESWIVQSSHGTKVEFNDITSGTGKAIFDFTLAELAKEIGLEVNLDDIKDQLEIVTNTPRYSGYRKTIYRGEEYIIITKLKHNLFS